ncbi:MAG: N-acetylglucosamine kinase [Bacilli bacterium]|nr:N-acetylglucosamine kinase [Bacilli bacterium]
MEIVVGIDGGGTKTDALFMDVETQKKVKITGEPSRSSAVGWDSSHQVIISLIDRGLQAFNATAEQLRSVSACLSGVDSPSQGEWLTNELQKVFPSPKIEVKNDAFAVLSAGTDGQPGIVLILGTGSIALGESKSGQVARAGGWGNLIGDEGSGYDIGRKGIVAAIQSFEKRGETTMLWEQACDMFSVDEPEDFISIIYGASHPVSTIASFAPIVLQCADATDNIAKQIVHQAVKDAFALVRSVQQQLNDEKDLPIVLAGGLLSTGNSLLTEVQRVGQHLPFQMLAAEPVEGALLRAIRKYTS